ncbi:MAG: ABC transporter permease subunit [Caldilineaceae bacterium]
MRGIPMLVLLLYISFAIVGLFISALNSIGIPLSSRDIPMELRAIVALGLGYGAFSAEIFRAGIQSIEHGQHEAAAALGMNYFQKMRFIVLPQAFRRILPAGQ